MRHCRQLVFTNDFRLQHRIFLYPPVESKIYTDINFFNTITKRQTESDDGWGQQIQKQRLSSEHIEPIHCYITMEHVCTKGTILWTQRTLFSSLF